MRPTLTPFDTRAEFPEWAGFRGRSTGTHSTRSIMIADLARLLEAVPTDAPYEAYAEAIVERNVLDKRTDTTRRQTLQRLGEFYAFDPEVPLFRALRVLWDAGEAARPLLALLSAAARDVLLRVSAEAVLPLETGALFDKADVIGALERELPARFTPKSRPQIARITAASWTQSGHLDGHSRKVRRHVDPPPAAVAYAVLLGYLCGERGGALFSSPWAVCLDAPAPVLQDRARDAARHGWITYRRSGDVLDVDPRPLLTADAFARTA
ncbi:hypothetical protein [Rubrivirga sp. IMCC45206]|uniref:hypothetical protein n=1 Tax=Rubrivirga sp. IMCC45206 TaxID=3391614 RepID=UPI00399022EF